MNTEAKGRYQVQKRITQHEQLRVIFGLMPALVFISFIKNESRPKCKTEKSCAGSNGFYGDTAQSAFGIFRKICALISSLFLAIHKVFTRKSAIIRTQIFSESALAVLCGVALYQSKYRPVAQISAFASSVPVKTCWGVPSPNPAERKRRSFFLTRR